LQLLHKHHSRVPFAFYEFSSYNPPKSSIIDKKPSFFGPWESKYVHK